LQRTSSVRDQKHARSPQQHSARMVRATYVRAHQSCALDDKILRQMLKKFRQHFFQNFGLELHVLAYISGKCHLVCFGMMLRDPYSR